MSRAAALALVALTACSRPEAPVTPAEHPPEEPRTGDPADALKLGVWTSEVDSPEARAKHPDLGKGVARLRFVPAPRAYLADHLLTVTGYLVNETDLPVSFPVAFGSPVAMDLSGETPLALRPVTSPPAAPPPPPPPLLYTIPPRTKMVFQRSFALDLYAYPKGGHVDLTWSVGLALDAPTRGFWKDVALPADGPRGEVRPPPPG